MDEIFELVMVGIDGGDVFLLEGVQEGGEVGVRLEEFGLEFGEVGVEVRLDGVDLVFDFGLLLQDFSEVRRGLDEVPELREPDHLVVVGVAFHQVLDRQDQSGLRAIRFDADANLIHLN